ncbi:MAG: hypothetical protein GOMPHAMPRED_000178 [Gomphillus americanus]|uniref:L-xylulose reductase n=1 Tax=Gomphillus americanus TaxID=1940652 RepID=A0A8H3EDK7_9LECA|nr:MAG: hypothetical protein GOMPHAMPRED_000178 [Gomphillus americanus]
MTSSISPEKKGDFNHNNFPSADGSKGVLPLFRLNGRTAIVSGAGQGIGLGVAQALAEAGANVAIWYNSNKKALDRAAEIEKKYGVKCKAYQVDVLNPDHVAEVIEEIVKEFNGRLDIVVANQGVPWQKGAMGEGDRKEKIEHYQKVVRTDLDGTFYIARIAGKDLNGNKLENYLGGSFVATASMSGLIVNIPQMQAAYNAAKAGVIHLCKSLAVEWAAFARANCVCPGYMATEISNFVPKETQDLWNDKTPQGRPGQVSELQGAFLYLASDASSFTTGASLVVDGGYSAP